MDKFNFINDVKELPDYCYGVLPSDNTIIIIEKNVNGYHPTTGYNDLVTGNTLDERYASATKLADELNSEMDITPDERHTMELRSMSGNWSSKESKTEGMKSTRPLADIRIALPFAYDDLLKTLEDGIKNGNMSEAEVSDYIKSINTNWTDEDVNKIITDYRENYMEDKAEPTDEEIVQTAQSTMVKDWYKENYPSDELGDEIRDNLSFYDLYETLDNYLDTYVVLGVSDSLVRERVFDKLAEIMNVDYMYIYNQWLQSRDDTTDKEVKQFLGDYKLENKKAKGIKGRIVEVEEDDTDLDSLADEVEPDDLDEIIEEHTSKSPMHEAIINEILDDLDEYNGETKLEKLKAKLNDVFTGPINDGGIKSLCYYSDTCAFYNTYETDIEDIIFDMQDNGLEPLETLRTRCDDAEIIMQEDNVKNMIVEMVYAEVLQELDLAIEDIKGE